MALTAADQREALHLLSRYRHAPPASQVDWQLVGRIVALYRGRRVVHVYGNEAARAEFARCTGVELNAEHVVQQVRTWFARPWEVFVSMRLCRMPAALPPQRPVPLRWCPGPRLFLPQPEHDATNRCIKCRKPHLSQGYYKITDILQCLGW